MKRKYRVQEYENWNRFIRRSEKFLLSKESRNNLFWEVGPKVLSSKRNQFYVNVFSNGEIIQSAILTNTDYLLLSDGTEKSISYLTDSLIRKKIIINGILGPSDVCNYFVRFWSNYIKGNALSNKKFFRIYELPCKGKKPFKKEGTSLLTVGTREWPRIRLWSMDFANTSSPPISKSATVNMARGMMEKGDLYVLKLKGKSCAMGGFGRETPHIVVINMVYVPVNERHLGYASKLTHQMSIIASQRGYHSCILFSDYMEKDNLYLKLGCLEVGEFTEISFN